MGDFWKPTNDMYSSLFPKPRMDEQLLKKPPFKYLFDILSQTTKVTGFGKGLLNEEETNPKFYESRERKIAYLQKFIDLVKIMGKEELQAKPAKIVAGLEPELTNAMLQSVYKLAVSGDSSDPYIGRVLGGEGEEKVERVEKVEKQEKKETPAEKKGSEKDLTSNKNIKETTQPPENPRTIRPPSAPRRGPRPTGETTQPPPQQKETVSRQGSRQAEKEQLEQPSQRQLKQQEKQIKKEAQNYSKKVKEALEQNEEVKPTKNEEPVKKVEMGNLRKRKNQSRTEDAGSIGSVGEINEKELESVKALIQSICQNSTPLSKSIQFLNDDVEAMNQQLNYWRKQYNVSKGKLQNELKITEDALVPLYDKLAEIDEQIKDQKGKIQNVKAQIIKNQATINALLYSVVKG